MLKSFFHTGFVVRDIEKSVAFYQEVMGLRVVVRAERSGEYAEKLLGLPGAHLKIAYLGMGDGHLLELIQYIVPKSQESHISRNDLGASHLCFLVDDIDAYYTDISQKGLRFINPPAYLYDEDKLVRKTLYGQDPDNNWLEFVEILQ